MPLAGSYTTKKDPVYKDSKRKFKKRALMGDYSDREPGSEVGRYKKGYAERMSKKNRMRKKEASSKETAEFYKSSLGTDYETDEVEDANVEKVKETNLKDFLIMHDKFSHKNPKK